MSRVARDSRGSPEARWDVGSVGVGFSSPCTVREGGRTWVARMAAGGGTMRSSVDDEATGLRDRLRDRFAELSPAQQRLAAFLLDNLSTASDYTITELAEAAGVSVG